MERRGVHGTYPYPESSLDPEFGVQSGYGSCPEYGTDPRS